MVGLVALSSRAYADDCGKGLDKAVRETLAKAYECGSFGYRCIDGHNGRVFGAPNADSDGYNISSPYQLGVSGATIQINVFSTVACAQDRLSRLEFRTSTIMNHDSIERAGRTTNPKNDKAATEAESKVNNAKSKADAAVDDAKKKLDEAVDEVKKKDSKVVCQKGKDACLNPIGDAKFAFQSSVDLLDKGDAHKALEDVALQFSKIDGLQDLAPRLRAVSQAYDDAWKAVVSTLEGLNSEVQGIDGLDSDLASALKDRIAEALRAARNRNRKDVASALAAAGQEAAIAKVTAEDTVSWNGIMVGAQTIATKTYSVTVPEGDDNRFFTITASTPTTGGTKPDDARGVSAMWAPSTLTVKVDHGKYYWDFGLTFAGVYHGERVASGDKTACPEACRWKFQSMLTGTLFFAGRSKSEIFQWRNLYPGLQVGINSDVTKIAEAVSLGLIEEPISGLGISAGVMFYQRARSTAANADGTFPQEHRFVPYIGVTLNKEFIDTIKNLASSDSKKAGNSDQPQDETK